MNAPELRYQLSQAHGAVKQATAAIAAARAAVDDDGRREMRNTLLLMEADAGALQRQLELLRKWVG